MKRVFSCVVFSRFSVEPYFTNEFISGIYEGIQKQGGDIIDIQTSYIERVNVEGEHLLITYEDNGHFNEIEEILKDKRDNITKKI